MTYDASDVLHCVELMKTFWHMYHVLSIWAELSYIMYFVSARFKALVPTLSNIKHEIDLRNSISKAGV